MHRFYAVVAFNLEEMAVFTLADVKSVTVDQLPATDGQVILDVRFACRIPYPGAAS